MPSRSRSRTRPGAAAWFAEPLKLARADLRRRLAARDAPEDGKLEAALAERLRASAAALAFVRCLEDAPSLSLLAVRLGEVLAAYLEAGSAGLRLAAPDGRLRGFLRAGREVEELSLPADRGLVGAALGSGQGLTCADPQIDPRFDPEVDLPEREPVRTLLCLPLLNSAREAIGVLLAADRSGGSFDPSDVARARAVAGPLAAVLECGRRLDRRSAGESEAVFDALTSAVLTVDAAGRIARANLAARRLFRREREGFVGLELAAFLSGANAWAAELATAAAETGRPRTALNASLALPMTGRPPEGRPERRRSTASVNLQAVPLAPGDGAPAGCLLVIEDITREQRLRGTLARYMPPEVAERLLEEGEEALGGRVHKASVLFTDLRDFTALSERLGPRETVSLLNESFSLMVDVILEHHGTLDKYIGDGLMAVFGAPYPVGDDAENAVQAALGMLRALRGFNLERLAAGRERVRVGIGVNTDEVLSGNIGSPRRMDYTVIGDGVNLASRLEGANKEYGTELLISEFTLAELKGSYVLREVDRLRVKGRQRPVAAFELLDYAPEELLGHLRYVVALYNEGLERYRRRQWEAARRMFDEALQQRPDDGPSRLYRERCTYFLSHPPPEDWDGVWVLKGK